jgi:hypothetical protein
MRAKLGIGAALLLLVVPVTVVIGAATASGQSDIHVVLDGRTATLAFLDLRGDGDQLSLGDALAGRVALTDASGDRVGKAYQHCEVVAHIAGPTGGMYRCSYVLHLEAGNIMLEGLDPHGPGRSLFAVMGGTGSYSTARGQAVFTDTKTTTIVDIDLSG